MIVLAGCTEVLDDHNYYILDVPENQHEHVVRPSKIRESSHPYVVNNTPHVRSQELPPNYVERRGEHV